MIYDIMNTGQIATIGHGQRRIIALEPKRKFIILVDPFELDVAKVPLKIWDRTKKKEVPGASRRTIKHAMQVRLAYRETKTKAIKMALRSLSARRAKP
jgi:hypothetical protein